MKEREEIEKMLEHEVMIKEGKLEMVEERLEEIEEEKEKEKRRNEAAIRNRRNEERK